MDHGIYNCSYKYILWISGRSNIIVQNAALVVSTPDFLSVAVGPLTGCTGGITIPTHGVITS